MIHTNHLLHMAATHLRAKAQATAAPQCHMVSMIAATLATHRKLLMDILPPQGDMIRTLLRLDIRLLAGLMTRSLAAPARASAG